MKRTMVAVLLLFTAAFDSPRAMAQRDDAKRLVGTWRLVSTTNAERGPHPTGILIYDARGNMAAQLQADRPRRKYAGSEPTPDEAKALLTSYLAYFGTYTVEEKAKTVTHHQTGNLNPDLKNNVRRYEFVGANRLVLRPIENQTELIWERISP